MGLAADRAALFIRVEIETVIAKLDTAVFESMIVIVLYQGFAIVTLEAIVAPKEFLRGRKRTQYTLRMDKTPALRTSHHLLFIFETQAISALTAIKACPITSLSRNKFVLLYSLDGL